MLPLHTKQQHHLDLCIFSCVPGVGGRVNRLVGNLKNPLVLPVRPFFSLSLSLSFFSDGKNGKRNGQTNQEFIVQLQKTWTHPEQVVQEFDHIKDHLESYIMSSTTTTTTTTTNTTTPHHRPRIPSRHISHLTQMAAKALNRPVHGLAVRKRPPGQGGQQQVLGGEREKVGWDELEAYKSKNANWREVGLGKGMEDVEAIKMVEQAGWEGVAALDRRWDKSWECDRMSK